MITVGMGKRMTGLFPAVKLQNVRTIGVGILAGIEVGEPLDLVVKAAEDLVGGRFAGRHRPNYPPSH